MISIDSLRVDYKKLRKENRYRVIHSENPAFSWSVRSNRSQNSQKTCQVRLLSDNKLLWDSGIIESKEQTLPYCGPKLPKEQRITVSVSITDVYGETAELEDYFFISGLSNYQPHWIANSVDKKGTVSSFYKDLLLVKPLKQATLYVSGIGYHEIYLNQQRPDDSVMEPLFSDYTKTVYFSVYPEAEQFLKCGSNAIRIDLGEGWRRNDETFRPGAVHYFGTPQLAVILHLIYDDGSEDVLFSDESWKCSCSNICYSNLFQGETYDANIDTSNRIPVITVPGPGGVAVPAVLEPIVAQETYAPVSILALDENTCTIDFGQNIAGVFALRLPKNMQKGQKITVRCSEMLETDGHISGSTMRSARSEDTYIASGDPRDLSVWMPRFTYHGFQMLEITGYPLLSKDDITAISYYTDIASNSNFHCGSAIANAIHKMVVQTEKANIHGILTDCPQRDERMGWLNDATVRFEETPYNFDIATIFPKIIADIRDTQGEDGSITCTAPHTAYGNRPADPVCSSFLVAAWQAYLHTGNKKLLEENYDALCRWEDCLLANSENYIVNYSYYGDWAGPIYACKDGTHNIDSPISEKTPGKLMSTGFSYYNAVLLARMAQIIGSKEKQAYYENLSEKIRQAMLDQWWDDERATLGTGSHGCQVFGLWLGVIPEAKRQAAAKVLHDDLVKNHLRFTTANLCTKYLFDVLVEYGYVDTAWEIFTKETYPSFGYMLQRGGTTVWERLESKESLTMNSHCHPMYGAADYWLYAYIVGVQIKDAGCNVIKVKPYFPEKLMSAQAEIDTVKGSITVRWMKQFGELALWVDVPFGVEAEIEFDGKITRAGSGLTILKKEIPRDEFFSAE